jgi:hypothetical protein
MRRVSPLTDFPPPLECHVARRARRAAVLASQRYRALFDEQGRVFQERNTTDDPAYRDELASMGVMVTPAVVIGDRAVPGFRPNTVTELLAS